MIKTSGEIKLWDNKNFDKSWISDRYNNSHLMNESNDFTPSSKLNFSDLLKENIVKVNGLQQEANHAIEELATGKSQNLHETLLIVEKADIAFKTMNQIRGKVLDIYREMMKMQL